MNQKPEQGISVVELLIVMAVLGIVFALLTAFFTSHVRTTNFTQAANEVEVKVRTAAEVMAQDLQMTGSRIVFNDGQASRMELPCNTLQDAATHCVATDEPGSLLTLYYATSLRSLVNSCRRVDYALDAADGILMRSDTPCKVISDPTGDPDDPDNWTDSLTVDFQPFADNIASVTLSFLCEDGTAVADPGSCYGASPASFPIQSTVTVDGASQNTRENRTTVVSLTATMNNLRPIAVSEPPSDSDGSGGGG